jgi:hypothetical protein
MWTFSLHRHMGEHLGPMIYEPSRRSSPRALSSESLSPNSSSYQPVACRVTGWARADLRAARSAVSRAQCARSTPPTALRSNTTYLYVARGLAWLHFLLHLAQRTHHLFTHYHHTTTLHSLPLWSSPTYSNKPLSSIYSFFLTRSNSRAAHSRTKRLILSLLPPQPAPPQRHRLVRIRTDHHKPTSTQHRLSSSLVLVPPTNQPTSLFAWFSADLGVKTTTANRVSSSSRSRHHRAYPQFRSSNANRCACLNFRSHQTAAFAPYTHTHDTHTHVVVTRGLPPPL